MILNRVNRNNNKDLKILDTVDSPDDLNDLGLADLRKLAKELREEIIGVVSHTGGHLAPNLGVIEITLALHTVFNSPVDKIFWDVGHQAYAHKLLTGRRDQFHTLRTHGGISGFPKPEESEHDVFAAGHASTSLAAAMGYAKARDLKDNDEYVIAVIGDGALTGGMALEALNNAGEIGSNFIIILNDNGMSISPNTGAFSRHLTKLRTVPTIRNIKAATLKFLRRIPGIGKWLARTVDSLQESVFYFFSPSKEAVIFEEMGFTYLGPFDGHNMAGMLNILQSAKKLEDAGPVLIHFLTKKGKGYNPSEQDATKFHGIGAFNVIDGKIERKKGIAPSYTSVFSDAMCMLGHLEPRIYVVTAAMTDGTGTGNFGERFPDRFQDVGIAEQFAVTYCAGLARGGMKPVAAIYSTFLQRAFDQIIHDVALQNLNVFFVLDRGGLVGDDGETHQGAFDLSYLRLIPKMVIMSPKDENELKDMLYTGVKYDDGPIALRYPRGSAVGVKIEEGFRQLPIGKGEILREGENVCIIAVGHMTYPALDAAELLADDGIEACVINARFVKPLDEELILNKARGIGRILTCEENALKGGFGSGVSELLHMNGTRCAFDSVGLPDKFIEHGSQSILRGKYGLDANGIYLKAKALMASEIPLQKPGHEATP